MCRFSGFDPIADIPVPTKKKSLQCDLQLITFGSFIFSILFLDGEVQFLAIILLAVLT